MRHAAVPIILLNSPEKQTKSGLLPFTQQNQKQRSG